ncbi:zinc finger MYM-type protein 3 isoform X3 [Macrobrachium rosenbergii]|uniref:zinc finger MYM-type protein 3 isoform X3 n=1 Tax=Macrobrachium rosenbergii TaxID=79674 RepID=UPI0034D6580D
MPRLSKKRYLYQQRARVMRAHSRKDASLLSALPPPATPGKFGLKDLNTMDESQPENMEVDPPEENNITSKSASSGDSNRKGPQNTNSESNNLDMETDAVNNTSDVENCEKSSQSVKTGESEKEVNHEVNDSNCHSSEQKSQEDSNDKEGSKNGHSNSPADSSGSPEQRKESSPNRTDDENEGEKSDVARDDETLVDGEDSQPSGTKENSSDDKVESGETGSDLAEEKEETSSDKKDEAASRDGVEEVEKEGANDIEEIPVYKKPAELIDLEDDDGKNSKKVSAEKEGTEEESTTEDGTKDTAADDTSKDTNTEDNSKDNAAEDSSKDSTGESNSKGLKLRSLASLVDTSESDSAEVGRSDAHPLKSGSLVPNPEAFGAIGEIVEHKDMFFDPDAGGLPLRISNVVGGEDCITGLAMDDDRDMFSSIQIASVTTLIDPISPEDPNKENVDATEDVDMEKSENANLESSEESGIKIVSAESLASKEEDNEKANDSSGPKLRISSAVSEIAKDIGVKDSSAQAIVYHILRSILTMPRVCIQCGKKVKCDFRITKKGEHGTFSFICSSDCRNNFVNNLKPTECVEKPRLIFEKLCGMCHKDLTTQPRSGQFSWETREFCSEDCLTSHLEEVAGKCHMCNQAVRPVYIGKYCVRFGSDIHQFCSNHCLERYKTKIKVCCYCQKNVENVNKVTSPANKEYCSIKCLKRAQRRDMGQQNYSETRSCTVCQAQGLNRYEFLLNGESQQLCSDPCLNVFKYVNKVKAVTCCLCFRVMNAEDVSQYLYHGGHQLRVFCSDSCVNVFVLSARKIVICDTCKVKKYNFDMIHRQVDEDFREFYYCSLHCLKTRDMGATSADKTANSSTSSSSAVASGNISSSTEAPIAVCSMCNTVAKAQFHMVMSDSTLRSFCRYNCASRYKSTFGFLVDSAQSKDTSSQAKNAPVSTIRPKPTSQLTSNSTSSSTNSSSKAATPALSQETLQATTELLKMLVPPTVVNKTTMCKPSTCTKGVYCKPHPWHRHTQTDLAGIDSNMSDKEYPPILPVPIPCYVPSPMCMYNVPCPVPIFVPIPLPVPVFLPTSAKTSKDVVALMKKIQDEIPTDPIQAEMLLLARQTIEQEQEEARSEDAAEQAEEPASPVDNFTTYSGDDEAGNDEAVNDELNSADEACLNTMEEDLPRYPLRDTEMTSNYSETETHNENKGKRKKRGRGRPRKRLRRDSDESQSLSDAEDVDDPDFFPEPETVLEEEFQGPFLNKMYGLTAWKSWVTKKNAELAGVSSSRSMKLISEDLLTMNCDELNYALCLFLKDLRKPNGEAYQPDTILYLLLGIQQHLFESARTDCIFMDFGFEKFTNSLDEITRTFWVAPTLPGVSPMISLGVTRITEAMLWECRQLGAHTPQVLLNTLFYFNTKVFRLRTVEEHLAMSFVQIVKQWRRSSMGRDGSGTRTTLLKYYPKKSSADGDKPRPNYEMHENRDDPLRCPVKLYEFYLSKCPESVRNQRNIYYVYPERSCVPDSPVWFSTQAVHASSIAKMLHRALMVREVQEAFAE